MLNRVSRLLAVAVFFVCGAATNAYAHPGHSTSHDSHVARGAPTAGRERGHSSARAGGEAALGAEVRLGGKASSSRGAKAGGRRPLRGAARARAVQEEIDLEESAGTCERARCSCTSSSHGTRNCYTNSSRGDCPTHVGLLCIWAD